MRNPSKNPVTTCERLCWRSTMRAEPTMPESSVSQQNHQMGLKKKSREKPMTAPVTPPMAAECVDIFHQILMTAQVTCMTSAVMRMLPMMCGMR